MSVERCNICQELCSDDMGPFHCRCDDEMDAAEERQLVAEYARQLSLRIDAEHDRQKQRKAG